MFDYLIRCGSFGNRISTWSVYFWDRASGAKEKSNFVQDNMQLFFIDATLGSLLLSCATMSNIAIDFILIINYIFVRCGKLALSDSCIVFILTYYIREMFWS